MTGDTGKPGEKEIEAGRAMILGVPVSCLTMRQAVENVCRAWNGGRAFHVVTANAEMLYRCSKDKVLAEIVKAADLVTADGAGVVLASRILGSPAPQRVAGFDLMVACLKEAARSSVPVYFLGSHPQVLQAAIANAGEYFPGLNVAGSHHGYFRDEEDEDILGEIRLLKPSLLFVAMGVPKQEKWIFRHKEKLPPGAVIGVGGSFDVLAGKARRAPLWMQRAGLEWLYRFLKEPSRVGRIAVLPLFLAAVLLQALFGVRS
ncbi:MAG: glycosyltransferase [Dethiobacter sp.]|jgi:N-acetylglucosaminyldiphosphoundecaprenol N-acetyl-beta-D-mannosaminyltransferase|nr:MAG: glycosyltransferase [Dethiobacter sp.]